MLAELLFMVASVDGPHDTIAPPKPAVVVQVAAPTPTTTTTTVAEPGWYPADSGDGNRADHPDAYGPEDGVTTYDAYGNPITAQPDEAVPGRDEDAYAARLCAQLEETNPGFNWGC